MNSILETLAHLTPNPSPLSLGAALAATAARKGDKWAVTCAGETLSWRTLHRRTNRLCCQIADLHFSRELEVWVCDRAVFHGAAGAMVVFGGAVKGGRVIADWPDLKPANLYAAAI